MHSPTTTQNEQLNFRCAYARAPRASPRSPVPTAPSLFYARPSRILARPRPPPTPRDLPAKTIYYISKRGGRGCRTPPPLLNGVSVVPENIGICIVLHTQNVAQRRRRPSPAQRTDKCGLIKKTECNAPPLVRMPCPPAKSTRRQRSPSVRAARRNQYRILPPAKHNWKLAEQLAHLV